MRLAQPTLTSRFIRPQLVNTLRILRNMSSNNTPLLEELLLPFKHHKHYYPARIGDTLKNQYRIIAKLGYGAYSTVLLAWDQRLNNYASLKICIRDDSKSSPVINEINMLQHLEKFSKVDHPGVEYTRLAREIFEIDGPTGSHYCIATQPQGPSLRALQEKFPNAKLPKLLVRSLVHRIIFSINFLHVTCGVIHTDISPQNVLERIDDTTSLQKVADQESKNPSVVSIIDGSPVYESREVPVALTGDPMLTDFGQMRLGEHNNSDWWMPDLYRAPEILLKLPWGFPVDLWSIGVMTLELLEGRNLFGPIDYTNQQYVLPLALAQYISYLGPPPLAMIQKSPLFTTFFDETGTWISEPSIPKASFEDFVTTIPPGDEKKMFLRFIRRMLTWDPEVRATSFEIFNDDWLMDNTLPIYLLAEQHFDTIDVFEQRDCVGGVWNLSPASHKAELLTPVPQENAKFPTEKPIWQPTAEPHSNTDKGLAMFLSPLYDELETNIMHKLMELSGLPFPKNTQLFPKSESVLQYLQEYSKDIEHLIHFQVQVMDIMLEDESVGSWAVTRKCLQSDTLQTDVYDAVVVANGHYNVPYVPSVPGIDVWHKSYAGAISHSKSYFSAEPFRGKKVLVVGNSASGIDIGSQIGKVCLTPLISSARSESYFTAKPSDDRKNVSSIEEFLSPERYNRAVRLSNGEIEDNIDYVVFCTGYLYSFPFLSALEPPVIKDGSRTLCVYQHMFYIEHPTLIFPLLNQKISPFPIAEAQGAVLSRVLSGRLSLPIEEDMYAWEEATAALHGSGKTFHFLPYPLDAEYLQFLYDWAASAETQPGLERDGNGKECPLWGEKERWLRSLFTNIKQAFVAQGEAIDIETEHSDTEYPIKGILDETLDKYLVEWEGNFEPTWEPKHFVNDAAIAAWNLKKQNQSRNSERYRSQRPLRNRQETYYNSLSQSSSSNLQSQNTQSSGSIFVSRSTQQSPHTTHSQDSGFSGDSPDQPVSNLSDQSLRCSSAQVLTEGSPLGAESFEYLSQSTYSPEQSVGSGSQLNSARSLSSRLRHKSDDASGISRFLKDGSFRNSGSARRGGHRSSSINNTERNTPHSRYSGTPFLCTKSAKPQISTSHCQRSNDPTIRDTLSNKFPLEIAETPESQLQVQEIDSRTYSISQFPLHALESPPLSNFSACKTPHYPQKSSTNISATNTVSETVYHGTQESVDVSPSSFVRLNPQYSDEGRHTSISRRSYTQKSSENLEYLEDPFYAMENSSSQQPKSLAEAARNNPGTTYGERMQYFRALERASIKPLQSLTESATPSSAGDIEPSGPPVISKPGAPLSIRHEKVPLVRPEPETETPVPFVSPQALHYNPEQPALFGDTNTTVSGASDPSPLAALELAAQQLDQDSSAQDPTTIKHTSIPLRPFEFLIPLSMDSRVKDDYDRTLETAGKHIQKFMDDILPEDLSKDVEIDVERILEQLNNITTHPDLNLPEQPSSGSLDAGKEASWAEYSSSKFQFLGYFMDAVLENPSTPSIHVVLMAKPGPTIDILKKYFLGKLYELISEGPNAERLVFRLSDLTFEIRSTVEQTSTPPFKNPSVIIAFDNSFDADAPSLLQLRNIPSSERLIPVIKLIISNTAEHIALCLPQCSGIDRLRILVQCIDIYSNVAGDLQDDALGVQENAEETLRYLLADPETREWPLPEVSMIEIPTSIISVSELERLRTELSSGQKRLLEDEADVNACSSKRQRMTPFQDITHISDSLPSQTQERLSTEYIISQGQKDKDATAEIKELRAALVEAQGRVEVIEASSAKLQFRYESKHELYLRTRRELDTAVESTKKLNVQIEKQKMEILKLNEEKSALYKDLEDARNALKSGGGLMADLETAREEIRALSKEKASLERISQQDRSQSEFTRQQYQNASTAAAQSSLEARQLKDQIEELKRKSSDEASKLKELRLHNNEKKHLDRVSELEKLLSLREKLLATKEEELREMRKNRPTTRSTSTQPRSPKFSSSSRPESPAPGSSNTVGRGSVLRFRVEP
ncbi:hypothetical protein LOZ02_000856 [Ophidiomyces ophidiicola]|nr:hypothetical protein LOZ02_000856 [Ophidiomyces ophidiicola]